MHKRDSSAENEILIGNIIRKINNYELFFSPVIKSCGVNLANIDRNLLSKCDVVNEKKDNEYILLDILYINSNQFIELIKSVVYVNPNARPSIEYIEQELNKQFYKVD